jgi:hypothetical protein
MLQKRAYRLLVAKPEGNVLLGTLRCRWEDNIKIDLGSILTEA